MGKLDNKVAIITGGSQGQGASHARRFIEEGAKVVLTDILVKKGEELAKELGGNAKFIKHDVSSLSEWEEVIDETEDTFGSINILVNNAGIAIASSVVDMTEEEYKKVIEINQYSVFFGMKTVFKSMYKTRNGSIINISSTSGLKARKELVSYVASKFAIRGMTKVAALEFAEYGIRVNSVHPGFIETSMIRQEGGELEDTLKEREKLVPLGRIGKPGESTNLVLFLASNESSYSTDSEFLTDGGLSS